MRMPLRLLACLLVLIAASGSAQVVAQVARPTAPMTPEAALAAKCRAASFARRPAGQMATTMRELQIQRCIKNNGFLD